MTPSSFSLHELRMVAPFMEQRDKSRIDLWGVYCDPAGLLVASDGYTIGATRIYTQGDHTGRTIPDYAVTMALSLYKRGEESMCSYDGDTLEVVIPHEDSVHHRTIRIEAKARDSGDNAPSFPKWRRCLQNLDAEECHPVFALSVDRMHNFRNAVDGAERKITCFSSGQNKPIIVLVANPGFLGFIMPSFIPGMAEIVSPQDERASVKRRLAYALKETEA